MKKVFLIHGFEGSPNGGWRPWLMAQLEKLEIYACALPMPTPENPICNQWVEEIARNVDNNPTDEIYLVGHSLGVPAILRYLESSQAKTISGVVLVSGPSQKNNNRKIDNFLETDFNFEKIKQSGQRFCVIHGSNDPYVPLENAQFLAQNLGAELVVVENGGHLNSSAGWFSLPQALEALKKLMNM